jgi:hypothetical protein
MSKDTELVVSKILHPHCNVEVVNTVSFSGDFPHGCRSWKKGLFCWERNWKPNPDARKILMTLHYRIWYMYVCIYIYIYTHTHTHTQIYDITYCILEEVLETTPFNAKTCLISQELDTWYRVCYISYSIFHMISSLFWFLQWKSSVLKCQGRP